MKAIKTPQLLQIEPVDWTVFANQILAIEKRGFPPTLRDSRPALRALVQSPTSLVLGLTENSGPLIGYIGGDKLEAFPEIPGIRSDGHFGHNDTAYIETLAVTPERRHQGYGTELIRAFQKRALKHGFSRTTAHIASDSTHKIKLPFRKLGKFPNWYHTGRSFDYIEFAP